ncbi:MAG: helix-turn-helix transcriptional regulator [Campylobacterales bacterium]|nr:helix-turn-helix transcriptional regulator [Campylobacterales bacterium]
MVAGRVLEKCIDYFDLIEVVTSDQNPFDRESKVAKVKPEYGEGSFVWRDAGNGIATSAYAYVVKRPIRLTISSNVAGAVLIFNLGCALTHIFQDGKSYTCKPQSFFIGFSSTCFRAEAPLRENVAYHTFSIGIKEDLFLKLAHKLPLAVEKMREAKTHGYAFLEGGKIDPYQRELITAFSKEHSTDPLVTLGLESKATTLICHTLEHIGKVKNTPFDRDKIRSLERAQRVILNDYASALSIKEIARRCATNECYLKKDFKAYYGLTVHDMLQARRLEMAKHFLEEGLEVKEVTSKVGYKHAGHFSKRFAQAYGLSPSVYRKQLSH